MRSRWIPMVMATAIAAAGCAGAGRGDPTAIRPIITTASTTPTTTTTPTAPTTTTSAATTTTTTTTTEVEDPQATTKQEIADTVIRARQAFLEAVYAPAEFDPLQFGVNHTEREITHTSELIQGLVDDHLVGRAADTDLESITVISVQIEGQQHAVAIACVVSNTVIFTEDTDAVVNDTLSAELNAYHLVLVGQTWKVDRIENVSRAEGESSCGD